MRTATFFLDLDGTLLKFLTNEPLPKAVETVNALYDSGSKIVLTTVRDEEFEPEEINLPNTRKALEAMGLRYHQLIGGLPSPRIVVNDHGALGIGLPTDAGIDILRQRLSSLGVLGGSSAEFE